MRQGAKVPLRWTRLLRRWHRLSGVGLATFVVLLSLTGILLNHSYRLALPESPLPATLAAVYFGTEPEIQGFRVASQFVYLRAETLYLDQQPVGFCQQELAGAIALEDVEAMPAALLVLCDSELLLIATSGELSERLGAGYGVPTGLSALGRSGDTLLASKGEVTYRLDLVRLEFEPSDLAFEPVKSMAVPDGILMPAVVSWEQFILDLHSGKLLGLYGVMFSDLLAVLLIFMSISGIMMWWNSR